MSQQDKAASCPSCKGTGKSKSTLTMMEMRCFPCGGTGVTPYAGIGEIMQKAAPAAPPVAAPGASIDTPEFCALLGNLDVAGEIPNNEDGYMDARSALIAHIDAKLAQRYETGRAVDREVLGAALRDQKETIVAQRERIQAAEASLAEHKAARIAYASEFPLNEEGDPDVGNIHANIRALKASLARLVEGIAAASIWSLSPTMGVMVNDSPRQHVRQRFIAEADILALLPAKADKPSMPARTTSDAAYESLTPDRRKKLDNDMLLLEQRMQEHRRSRERRQHVVPVEVERRIADARGSGVHQDRKG